MTGLDDGLRGRDTVLTSRVQYWLAALLLMLVQRVEGDGCGTGAARRRRHASESRRVELVEVAVVAAIVVQLDS